MVNMNLQKLRYTKPTYMALMVVCLYVRLSSGLREVCLEFKKEILLFEDTQNSG